MRILVVSGYYFPAYSFGGPTHSLSALCESLVEQGAEVTVLTTNANKPKRLPVKTGVPVDVNGVQVWYFPLLWNSQSFLYSYQKNLAIWRQIESHDIIHASILWSLTDITIMRARIARSIPYVVTINGQLFPWALNQKRIKKKLFLKMIGNKFLEHAAACHCTERGEAEAVNNVVSRIPIIVLPNGIHTSRYYQKPGRAFFRQKFGIKDTEKVMLFLGRFHENKRPDIAIEVLALLSDRQTHLILAGPDEQGMQKELYQRAHALNCEDRVHFTGLLSTDDVIKVLNEVDLLLMPSGVYENFGMAALEALAVGVPVLTSDHVPMGRWAAEVGAGLALSGDPKIYSDAAGELLANPIRLAEMGARGRELARQKFDCKIIAHQMLDHYRSILKTGTPVINGNEQVL